MAPPLPRDPRAPRALVLVGPGPRAAGLARLLAALGAPSEFGVRAFDDCAQIPTDEGRAELLLLDADATPLEDVGYVRRYLAARAEVELVLVGAESRSRTARALGSRRFLVWPPDVDELAGLVRDAGRAPAAARASASSPARPPTAPSASAELDEVRAILEADAHGTTSLAGPQAEPAAREQASVSAAHPALAVEPEFEDLDAGEESVPEDPRRGAHGARAEPEPAGVDESSTVDERAAQPALPHAPPWWRAQVADLADVAQRVDLSVQRLAASAPELDEGGEDEAAASFHELRGEVARLLQFTRTLGYVAAPPPRGAQSFDLGEIVHLFAAGLAASGADAPRCQFKSVPGAIVRSDRQLLSQALDAVFFVVRCTARKGDLVRVQVSRFEDDGGAGYEVSIDFPTGPLEGFAEDEIVTPYALADLFPELGPNALAAATGIVAGQEGRLSIATRGRGRATWRLRLPLERG
ncbi:MAG: hypothetical protein JNK02_15220 [Planctomycetes bacterium]|nr:hypothetical protein [Planctomycetota bacterium]